MFYPDFIYYISDKTRGVSSYCTKQQKLCSVEYICYNGIFALKSASLWKMVEGLIWYITDDIKEMILIQMRIYICTLHRMCFVDTYYGIYVFFSTGNYVLQEISQELFIILFLILSHRHNIMHLYIIGSFFRHFLCFVSLWK